MIVQINTAVNWERKDAEVVVRFDPYGTPPGPSKQYVVEFGCITAQHAQLVAEEAKRQLQAVVELALTDTIKDMGWREAKP